MAFVSARGDRSTQARASRSGSFTEGREPQNAAELLALDDVDGALVGGASLDVESFAAIVTASVAATT